MASVVFALLLILNFAECLFVAGCEYGKCLSCPGKSCMDIYDKNPSTQGASGKYIIESNGLHLVHCDMQLRCGGGNKGWMRIAHTNVSNGDGCPNGWKKINTPVAACRAVNDNAGCFSANFNTQRVSYSRVCGMIVGYQKGTPDAFASLHHASKSINGPYLDGISVTYGNPRKHIWSFGAGLSDDSKEFSKLSCPCAKFQGPLPPSFARDHFYCESGDTGSYSLSAYYISDPLWDGKNCTSENSCCAQPNQPWFYHQIPLTSNKNIEVRICYDEAFSNEGVLVKELQLYVQ